MSLFLLATLLLIRIDYTTSQIPLAGQRTIGTAIKNGLIRHHEQTVFEETTQWGGVINYIWVTGDDTKQTRMRIYVDGETTPSLDFDFYDAVGIGFKDEHAPWSNQVMGKNAKNNAYLTYRIPFGQSIRITVETESKDAFTLFWFICRGLAWGSASLKPKNIEWGSGLYGIPSNSRLKLYKQAHVLQPYQFVTLYNKTTAGAVWMVTIEAESTDLNFLEGCFRGYLDGSQRPMFLSSGTEDFFNSAFYFDVGVFHSAMAGLTHKKQAEVKGNKLWQLGMYRTFDRDPLVFGKSLALQWRNCEHTGMGATDCPNQWAKKQMTPQHGNASLPSVAVMAFQSYVWVYEW